MAYGQLQSRNRALGVAGAVALNALLVAALLTLSTGIVPLRAVSGLVSFDVNPPPPPPPQSRKSAGAAAPPSRGETKAPSPPHPLPSPTPAQPSIDAGSQAASGAGAAPGSGAGQGGQGSGAGAGGSGSGSGVASLPVHVAGDMTDRDYRRLDLPRGAQGQVIVAIRVRSDGRVDQCRVVRSSGYPQIDDATCTIIEQRYRFRPALAADGRPVDADIQWQADWRPR